MQPRLLAPAFFLAVLVLGLPGLAMAEPAWRAGLSVSQEYNDNTGENQERKEDHITSLRPSLSYLREGGRLQLSSSYRGNYQFYAKETQDEKFNHNLAARALLDVWDEFLFLEATDTYRLVNRDRTRGEVSEDDDESTAGLVQQNTFRLSPFITPRIGDQGQAKIGYAYTNVWNEDGEDTKNTHRGFIDGDYDLTDRLGLLSGYSYTRELLDEESLDRHIAYLGGRYDYAENGNVYAKFGPQYTSYEDQDSSMSLYWDAGLTHDFGYVTLNLITGISFEDDPDTGQTYERRFGTVRLSKRWERTTGSIFSTLEEYDDGVGEEDDEQLDSVRRTALGFNLSHELTARLTGSLGLTHDFVNGSGDTKRWQTNLGLRYALSEKLGLGVWYRFKDSSSDDADDDFRVNRAGAQLSWTF